MAATATNNGTGFLDLPQEIRNKIYTLALSTPRKIQISLHTTTHSDGGKSYTWKSGFREVFARLRAEKKSLSPNILATCKQVHHEATPILYGNNQFSIKPVAPVPYGSNCWRSTPGSDGKGPEWAWFETSAKHLRHISVVRENLLSKGDITALLQGLRGAESLVTLEIEDQTLCDLRCPEEVARTLQPLTSWLHHICKKRIEDGNKKMVTRINWEPEALEVGGILTYETSGPAVVMEADVAKQAMEIALSKLK